jgi:hypothetical protein
MSAPAGSASAVDFARTDATDADGTIASRRQDTFRAIHIDRAAVTTPPCVRSCTW